MTLKPRTLALAGIGLFTAAAFSLLALSQAEYRVNLSSVLEIWGDVVRDVDHVGLRITRMSDEKEMELGWSIANELTYRQITDERARYVEAVGQSMASLVQRKRIRYHFHVLNDANINAYAIPGGHIYVTTGMLDYVESEAELAAVIGHEIAHVDLRHCVERIQYEQAARKVVGRDLASLVRLGHDLLLVGFSEQQELEADATGLLLAAEAHYDPNAAMSFFSRMAERSGDPGREKTKTITGETGRAVFDVLKEYFQTHPHAQNRLERLTAVYRKNANVWRGDRYYVGRGNLAALQPRSKSNRDGEWIDFRSWTDATGAVETAAKQTEPVTGLSGATDKDICKGVLYGNPKYVREAARRGLDERECRVLLGVAPESAGTPETVSVPETVTVPSEPIDLLDRMRIKQSTSVFAAPSEDATLLGYMGGTVTVTGRIPETGWVRIVWTGEIPGYIRSEALEP